MTGQRSNQLNYVPSRGINNLAEPYIVMDTKVQNGYP